MSGHRTRIISPTNAFADGVGGTIKAVQPYQAGQGTWLVQRVPALMAGLDTVLGCTTPLDC